MLEAFARAFAQLTDPRLRRPLFLSVALAALFFLVLWFGAGLALMRLASFDNFWLDLLVDTLGGLAALFLTWLLFPSIAMLVVGFFLEDVIRAVEARYYPGRPPPRAVSLGQTLRSSIALVLLSLLLNLLALPLYIFLPGINLFLFYTLNGYLLSREYFELVATRRLDQRSAKVLRHSFRLPLFIAGAGVAVLLTLPLVNLTAPLIGTAVMVHLFERYSRLERHARTTDF
jgi:uncharacterized protein involved in cysteine biosynthesis